MAQRVKHLPSRQEVISNSACAPVPDSLARTFASEFYLSESSHVIIHVSYKYFTHSERCLFGRVSANRLNFWCPYSLPLLSCDFLSPSSGVLRISAVLPRLPPGQPLGTPVCGICEMLVVFPGSGEIFENASMFHQQALVNTPGFSSNFSPAGLRWPHFVISHTAPRGQFPVSCLPWWPFRERGVSREASPLASRSESGHTERRTQGFFDNLRV